MHGEISLQSKIGQGTTAAFWIPFKKAEYGHNTSPPVDLGSIPNRLQSDLSVSCGSSDDRATPPATPISHRAQSAKGSTDNTLARAQLTSGEERANNLTEAERRATHILVVEDNTINQHIATKFIKKAKFSVAAVWNGQECLEYLDEPSNPTPAIILMDCMMPIMDGYRATQVLRSRGSDTKNTNIPVIAMTASAIRGDFDRCMAAGMNDYLAKPVKFEALEKMLVKWAIEGRRRTQRSSQNAQIQVPLLQPPTTGNGDTKASSPERQLLEFDTRKALIKTSETENVSSKRRADEEETAMSVRDNKLLDAASGTSSHPGRLLRLPSDENQALSGARGQGGTHALTRENMSRFVGEQDEHDLKDEAEQNYLSVDSVAAGHAGSRSSMHVHGSSMDDSVELRQKDSNESGDENYAVPQQRPTAAWKKRFDSEVTVRRSD